ncbi:MAG: hypothetical protein HQK79_05040 [Desulfobacterales bacterium]|nr:hypothetical protein [Desulfobacterales bacterium]
MRNFFLFISLFFAIFGIQIDVSYAYISIKIIIKVIDETGTPISNADARVSFIQDEQVLIKGKTDSKGIFIAEGRGINVGGVDVNKEGFYDSGSPYQFNKQSTNIYVKEITLTLKKKINPIPMYATDIGYLKIPEFGKPIGFDLEKRDWVAPYGNGIISDFIFIADRHYKDVRNADMSIVLSFSNPKDGILKYSVSSENQSDFIWPFEAPSEGYVDKINKWESIYISKGEEHKTNMDLEKSNYIFRVRTQIDSKGNIISAKYGKIRGEIIASRAGTVNFKYYFNPDGTRNLEFDTKKNLFKFSSKENLEYGVNQP